MTTPPTSNTASITPIIVFGATGRTGSRVCALALERPSFALLARVSRGASNAASSALAVDARGNQTTLSTSNTQDLLRFKGLARAIIDFSSEQGTLAASRSSIELGCAHLVATTALGSETLATLREASRRVPVLVAPNTSLGVSVLAKLATDAARVLGASGGYEVSIVEAHHSRKKDAPSGTALRLADAVREGGMELKPDQVLAMRGGDVIGEHTIRFAGPGEYLEFTHRATTRDLFALGALNAAAWLARQTPGWYTIDNMLNSQR